jgi:hypothetical protein
LKLPCGFLSTGHGYGMVVDTGGNVFEIYQMTGTERPAFDVGR